MAINYAVRKIRNPKGQEGTEYFHAQAIKTSEYDFEDLMDDINNSTTVTSADAMAVLRSMKNFITKALLAGRVVVLQDIGRFQVTLQGKCYSAAAMQEVDFSPSEQIKSHRIVFRPEVKLKNAIATGLTLKRVSSEVMP